MLPLILISSDLQHSLSQILPLQQSLIPVSFKRKLTYAGSYIEEYIERKKVLMYFNWFKKNNHLFKDLEFDIEGFEKFIDEAMHDSKEFENLTTEDYTLSMDDSDEDALSNLTDDELLYLIQPICVAGLMFTDVQFTV